MTASDKTKDDEKIKKIIEKRKRENKALEKILKYLNNESDNKSKQYEK